MTTSNQDNGEKYGNSLSKKSRTFRIVFCSVVTGLACLIAYLLMVPLSETLFSKLFSAPETSDFTMTDIFLQFADARPVRHLDDRIVIVDIGYAGREDIAEALEAVSMGNPKVVGLDVNFPQPKDEVVDNYLIESILMQKQIVLPIGLKTEDEKFEIEDRPFFYDSISSPAIHYASANLPAKSRRASIREYETEFPMTDGSVIPSYVGELARLGAPEMYQELKDRGNSREIIDYASREFTVIPIDKLVDRLDELTDKFVLIGSLADAYDLHATPLNSNIPGLMVHASALSTLLDGDFYTNVPDAVDYITGAIFCFLLVFASESLPGRGKGVVLRILQLAFLCLVVWVGYTLFIDNHTLIDLTFTFFVVGLGLLVLEIGNVLVNGWVWTALKRQARKMTNKTKYL